MTPYPLLAELHALVEAGLCKRQRHPRLPLIIYNYSQKAQFEYSAASWPEPLRDARGLILTEDGRVAARGFRKFFNLSQLERLPAGRPEFWEKSDGSLLLAFQYEGERVCATRGSFDSPQALWAHQWLAREHPEWMPLPGVTYCFEAVFPANRIVVDYGGTEELVLLAALDSQSALDRDEAIAHTSGRFRRARFYGERDPAAIPAQEGEGFVLRWPDSTRAKVKLNEYVRMHRLIFTTSSRTVWAALRAGEQPEEQAAALPANMQAWIGDYAARLRAQYAAVVAEAQAQLDEARAAGLLNGPRAAFAAWAKPKKPSPKLLFSLADGRSIDDLVWRMIEPEFERPVWAMEPEE
ncbi:MAG: hypothetical protein IT162_06905 [Bryobacterales bacterium]|nr:hypothetical protein [Bryobacterales bacterium]